MTKTVAIEASPAEVGQRLAAWFGVEPVVDAVLRQAVLAG